MNKQSTRTFASGILIAAICVGCVHVFSNKSEAQTTTKSNHVSINENELSELKKQKIQLQNEYDELKKQTESKQQTNTENKQSVRKEYRFQITQGVTIPDVADGLKKAGIIKDDKAFKNYIVKHKLEGKVKMGEYDVNSDMSLEQVIHELTK